MSPDEQNRRELAIFLRSRRERLRPEQVGFPAGTRRRTRGLRREEVAVLAGLSPTWYTYLEQARKIQPSPEVLDSIARVLQLGEDERRYLHNLAYGGNTRPGPLDADVPAIALIKQIVAAADGIAYPVYASDAYCDLLAWNRAASEWYDDWDSLPAGQRNIMHWMLTAPAARERLADWESDTRDAVARWRAETAGYAKDPKLLALLGEFGRISPEFQHWWNDHHVQEHRTRLRRFRHPRLGLQTLRIVPLGSPHFTAEGVVFHVPADDRGMEHAAGYGSRPPRP